VRGMAIAAAALALGFAPAAGAAQSAACGAQSMLSGCPAVYQALASAAPQFGIVAAAGNSVPGVDGTRGLTLGIIPWTTGALRVSAAAVHLPELEGDGSERSLTPVAVKLGTATRLFGGTAGGTGALDLLLEGGVLTGTGEGGRNAAILGAGARIGLLRETFATPGVALSGTFRHTGRMQYGSGCMAPACVGFQGEAAFGLNDLGARLTIGKRLGPVGVAAGAGWDRFSTTGGFIAYQGSPVVQPASGTAEVDVHDSRWSAFVNLSKGLLIGSVVAEAGWMSGGDAVLNYAPGPGGYDPGQGTFFGSIALRVQL
jgi:hypothetical protein